MILEAFLLSLNCVVILLILGGAGYVTAARGWYDKSSRVLLARLVTFLSLPAYLFSSVMQTLDHDGLLTLVGSMATPFISIWTCFLLSRIIARVCHVEGALGVFRAPSRQRTTCSSACPLARALRHRGDGAHAPLLLCEHHVLLTVGTTWRRPTGGFPCRSPRRCSRRRPSTYLHAAAPRLLTAIVFILLDFTPPKAIMDAAHYMGGITTPLALVFVGRCSTTSASATSASRRTCSGSTSGAS
ncbi:MAG: hypothetical protein ACLUHG_03545 [Sutterella wadsworthensis]